MSHRFTITKRAAAEGPSMLRHGRAWVNVDGIGRKHPRFDQRQCGVGVEWRVLPKSGFGVGVQLKWGTNASESTPDVSLHLGRLGDLWVNFDRVIPYAWLERHRPDGRVDYDTRVFQLNIDGERLRWACWARDGHWSRSDPAWMQGSVNFRDALFGRYEHSCDTVEEGTCVIPMPEANYPATYKIERRINRRTRPLGRLRDRLLGPQQWYSTELTPGAPVAIPGKGENSWDCDDDHIHSQSGPGRSIADAIGRFVATALDRRKRYGGEHMSVAS